MSVSAMPVESRWIREVADIYRRRGYSVLLSPGQEDVPAFLSGYHPDLIAKGADESIIVEVTAAGKAPPDSLRQLAEVVRAQPGWRLDLFVRDPKEVNPEQALSEEEIRTQLQAASGLATSGSTAAALLMAWAALEAAMRLTARNQEIELPGDEPGTLITSLYTEGFMDREDYDLLTEALLKRNAVAHGYRQSVDIQDVTLLGEVAERILAE